MTTADIRDMLKWCRAAELFDDKVFEMQRNLMLPAAHFDAIGSDFFWTTRGPR
jgi:hypothetical protein